MTGIRRFHRVQLNAKSVVNHSGTDYHGQVENISLNDALLSFSDLFIVPEGEECTLALYLDEDKAPLRLVVKITYSYFTMVGIKFMSFEDDAHFRLHALMEKVTAEPDELMQGREPIRGHAVNFLSDVTQ